MNRLTVYTIVFVVASVLYAVLFKFVLIDSILMISFVISTLAFIFTTEKQPEFVELLEEPKVHFYRKSRLNIYGYMMILSGVITAFGFYIASTNSSIRIGLLSLVLWLVLIIAAKLMTIYVSKIMLKDAVYDFVVMKVESLNNFHKSKVLSEGLDLFIQKRNRKKSDLINLLKNSKNFSEEEVDVITKLTLLYLKENEDPKDEVVSDEIKELNKSKSKK